MLTLGDYVTRLQRQIEEMQARTAVPDYQNAVTPQRKILLHFLNRTQQLAEAAVLMANARLGTPLFVLARVLCEDLFIAAWVSVSEENALAHEADVNSDVVRIMQVMVEKGLAKIPHKATGEDHTAEILPQMKQWKTGRKPIEQIAIGLGLGRAYDLVYRSASIEVHGKTYGLPSSTNEEGLLGALSMIALLIKAICLVVDTDILRNTSAPAGEILRVLDLAEIGGR
jgi:hypothetical protein